MTDVVQRFPGHATGQRAVADNGHDVTIHLSSHLERSRDTIGPRERAGGVRALNDVVLRLAALGVSRESPTRAQVGKVLTTGNEFVHVRLMSGVPNNGVFGRIENSMNCQRQLDNAKVRPKVPARTRNLSDEKLANLSRKFS
ncbi:unannotated protein [freshwater metagenome]|uniref:Unannotated protein n=1 Tax=freshwater metagenome TaxID=449393 RepID=A0A6J6CP02_9ZZZZ